MRHCTPIFIRLARVPTSAILACIATLQFLGCDSGTADTAGDAPASLVAAGKLTTTLDGQAVAIAYAGRSVDTEILHKINADPKGYACVVQLDLTVDADAAGSCRLELHWKRQGGELGLESAKFYAVRALSKQDGQVVATQGCAGWPQQSTTEEIVYEGADLGAKISLAAIAPPESNKAQASLSGLALTMTGVVAMKHKGKQFSLDLAALSFKGSAASKGRTDVSCGASGSSGVGACAKNPTYGTSPGEYLRRGVKLYRCDDESEYDLGELCGHSAIWVTTWADWTGGTLAIHGEAYDKFAKQDVGAAFIVVDGKEKVVVEDPRDSSKRIVAGPAPTAAECKQIADRLKIRPGVTLLFDKDRKMHSADTMLTSLNLIPELIFAFPDGKISALLPPDSQTKSISTADIEAALAAILGQ